MTLGHVTLFLDCPDRETCEDWDTGVPSMEPEKEPSQ